MDLPYLPKAGALPDCATPRTLAGQRLIGNSGSLPQEQKWGDSAFYATKRHQKCHQIPALFLLAALAFDPHILVLSWTPALDERVPATSAAACQAAVKAIAAGHWLADNPPIAAHCERGNVFAPGWDCIEGHNCGPRR